MKKVLVAYSSRTGTMQHVFKMDVTTLGPLNLTEEMVGTDEGLKACHDYAQAVAETL